MATYNAASAALADVTAELAKCVSGDTVVVPAGTATWGTAFQIPAGVTLEGQGVTTEITCTLNDSLGVARLNAGSTLRRFKFIAAGDSGQKPAFGANTGTTGWRISEITWTSPATAGGRFLDTGNAATWGVIDNCDITGPAGTAELIFTRGPTDAWDTPSTLGTDQAVYVEDCIFRGAGYVSDFNANSKGVVRNCTIQSSIKVDAHGLRTNSPERSTRHWEVYRNTWTGTGVFRAIELRGGTGTAFGNIAAAGSAALSLNDYCYGMRPPGEVFGNVWKTPVDWPVEHQIGRGQHATPGLRSSATSEPAYVWNNRKGGVLWAASHGTVTTGYTLTTNSALYPVGSTQITFIGGTDIAAGNYIAIVGDNTRYLVTVGRTADAQPITISPPLAVEIPATAVTAYHRPQSHYQGQVGSPTATFTGAMLIQKDRDFFEEVAGFNGSSGVGIGTRAQMDAILPTKPGVGFWVTDEGSWDTTLPADTSGRLYRWTGSAWELYYTPYTYPHPLRGALAAPAFISQPASRTVEEGQATTLTATASGNPAVTYQWRKGGVNISGATSSTLSFTNVQLTDAGSYDCVATNSQGSATSTAATLTVDAVTPGTAPTITTQPQSVTVYEGGDAVFSLHAEGDPLPTYQWRKASVNLSGKTTASLLISPASEADEGSYDCVVTNAAGSVTSSAATLTVDPAPASTPSPLGNRGTRAFLAGIF